MKNLLSITLIILCVINSKIALSDWKLVSKAPDGNEYFVDQDSIEKVNQYIFYKYLSNFNKPIKGIKSASTFAQVDCKLMRFKRVSIKVYKKPMGQNLIGSRAHNQEEWDYPQPKSSMGNILNFVCNP